MTAIGLRDVSVAFDGTRALDGLSHSVSEGAWLGVIGPNGAGKTTLLRAIAGLVGHHGDIRLGGDTVAALPRRRLARLVAFVPQRPFIPPGVTVTDYVLMGRTPYISYLGKESRHDLRVVGRVLGRLSLEPFARRSLDSLSGGELQRVVLARALAQEAPVLLLDEPTSFLDIGHQQQVLALVDELRVDHGLTIVSAMHDLTLAGQFADTLLLLASGRAVAAGSARHVLTEGVISAHYGATVRVLDNPDGGVLVIPVKPRAGATDSDRAVPS
ncbi:MAG: ABC transporter ATP-binding protein [Actinomycetota bacterium]